MPSAVSVRAVLVSVYLLMKLRVHTGWAAAVTAKIGNMENTKAWFLLCGSGSGDGKNREHRKYEGLIPCARCGSGTRNFVTAVERVAPLLR